MTVQHQSENPEEKPVNTRPVIIVEEVRQVKLELPEGCDDPVQAVVDAYNNGKITAFSKARYLNYEFPGGDWKFLWLQATDGDLAIVKPEDPEVVPVRVVVHPCREEEELTNEDYADDVHKRLMSCDGLQHSELANYEPIDYSFSVDDFALEDAFAPGK